MSTYAPIVVCALAATLYAFGGRGRPRRARELAFYAGLFSVLAVLEPPFDGWADSSFALHMTQHVVLMTVSSPLLVLGRPWPRLWLSLPLDVRRGVRQDFERSLGFRTDGAFLRRPAASLALMAKALS